MWIPSRLFAVSPRVVDIVRALESAIHDFHGTLLNRFLPSACSDKCGKYISGVDRRIHQGGAVIGVASYSRLMVG